MARNNRLEAEIYHTEFVKPNISINGEQKLRDSFISNVQYFFLEKGVHENMSSPRELIWAIIIYRYYDTVLLHNWMYSFDLKSLIYITNCIILFFARI